MAVSQNPGNSNLYLAACGAVLVCMRLFPNKALHARRIGTKLPRRDQKRYNREILYHYPIIPYGIRRVM